MKAVFLDRDGTVIVGIPVHERIDSVEKVQLFPDTIEALTELAKLDYKIFFITNQAGIAEGRITPQDFDDINHSVLEIIQPSGITITETYVCPHGLDENCDCRKPKPKMILDAAKKYDIDLEFSYMLGDRLSDVETGINAGTRTILVKSGHKDVEAPAATFTANNLVEAVRYIAGR